MKTVLLIAIFAVWTLSRAIAGPLDAPMLESQTVFTWDTDGDGTAEVRYLGSVVPSPGVDHIYNSVHFSLQTFGGMKLLQPANTRVPFQPGESIGSGAVAYSNGGGGVNSDNWMGLLSYEEAQAFVGAFWRYRDNTKLPGYPGGNFLHEQD